MYLDQYKYFKFISSHPKLQTHANNLLLSKQSLEKTSLKKIKLNYTETYTESFGVQENTHIYNIPMTFIFCQPDLSSSTIETLISIGFNHEDIEKAKVNIDTKVRQLIEKLFNLKSCDNYGKYKLLGTSPSLRIKEFQRLFSTNISESITSLQHYRIMDYWHMDFQARKHAKYFQGFLNQLVCDPKFQEYLFLCYLKELTNKPSFLDYLPHINFYYIFILSLYILLDIGIAAGLLYAGFLCNLLFVNELTFILFMITPILISFLTSTIISSSYSESIVNWIDSKDKLFNTDLTRMFYEIDKELEALEEETSTLQKKLS